ncbi:hypothetical protein [Streptacidiphilus sp. EB129]|uniref:hypothetical protein n=1 Tax=Streptacidiphilus sp. EB129 TaxID=3156262 RepID=UPI003512A600
MSARTPLRARTLGAAAVIAALAGAALLPAGSAFAAAPTDATAKAAATAKVAAPSVTAHSSRSTVGAWQLFQITGQTSHIKAGTQLTLQQFRGGHWVSLPAVTTVTRSGAYSLRVELGIKGANQLRIVGGGAVSTTVTVSVR